jgi:hypothetical protein
LSEDARINDFRSRDYPSSQVHNSPFESLTDVPTLNLLLPSVDPDAALYEAALRLVRTSRPVPRDVWGGKWTAWICLRGSFLAFTVDYDASVRIRKMVNFAQETRIVGETSRFHSSTGQCGCTILRHVSKKSALYSSSARAISTSFSFSADEAQSLRTSPTGR